MHKKKTRKIIIVMMMVAMVVLTATACNSDANKKETKSEEEPKSSADFIVKLKNPENINLNSIYIYYMKPDKDAENGKVGSSVYGIMKGDSYEFPNLTYSEDTSYIIHGKSGEEEVLTFDFVLSKNFPKEINLVLGKDEAGALTVNVTDEKLKDVLEVKENIGTIISEPTDDNVEEVVEVPDGV